MVVSIDDAIEDGVVKAAQGRKYVSHLQCLRVHLMGVVAVVVAGCGGCLMGWAGLKSISERG